MKVDSQKCFRAPALMALPGIQMQEIVQCALAAIEARAVVFLGNRFFAPRRQGHGLARQLARERHRWAFGAGGLSSSSRTRTQRLFSA
jgi:hypothetical protein